MGQALHRLLCDLSPEPMRAMTCPAPSFTAMFAVIVLCKPDGRPEIFQYQSARVVVKGVAMLQAIINR